jgi:hypothetical protein
MSPDAGDDADTEATDAISIGLLKGFLIDYAGPLALVLSVSLVKEFYDDFKRH